jgi:hypothetical protein
MVAIHLAMWISAEFAVRVMDWTFRFIIGDLTLVEDLVEFHEAANVGSHVKARTRTMDLSVLIKYSRHNEIDKIYSVSELP